MWILLKSVARGAGLMIASPAAFLCWLEHVTAPDCAEVFTFCANCCALLPGLPGMYVRRAFYQLTLEQCASDWYIGFGSVFARRRVIVEQGVYVGQYALVGSAALRARALVGSRVSLLSGPSLHDWDADSGWLPFDDRKLQRIEIGAGSWIGESAVVMADVGAGAMVAAGSVVSTAVAPGVMVGGNPARFVRRLASGSEQRQAVSEAAS